jgi:hypothetical protein
MATLGNIIKGVGQGIFNRTLGRLTGAGISTDSRIVNARAKWSGRSDKADWRVRLTGAGRTTDRVSLISRTIP